MKWDELIKLDEEKKECQRSIEIGLWANQTLILALSQTQSGIPWTTVKSIILDEDNGDAIE